MKIPNAELKKRTMILLRSPGWPQAYGAPVFFPSAEVTGEASAVLWLDLGMITMLTSTFEVCSL